MISNKIKSGFMKIVSFVLIISVILPYLSSVLLLINNNDQIDNSYSLQQSQNDSFDILEFWKSEINRVNSTPLNIVISDEYNIGIGTKDNSNTTTYKTREITFESPNWVSSSSATLKLHGYLLYPNTVRESYPACLCMHGLGDRAIDSFVFAQIYLEKGFVVLCHSHPGHGQSEGALPSPSNFLFEDDYNKSSHNYLTLCGAIQGLRVLESLPSVNKSQIMVTGSSYGALNSMWLAGICGDRIAGVLPHKATGDIESVKQDQTSLFYWVWNRNKDTMPESFWEDQNLRIDAIYYLKSDLIPPIMWQIGTTDEFFPRSSINPTYESVPHSNKFLQVFPDGHHGLYNFEATTMYFIDYIVFDGPPPPTIDNVFHYKMDTIRGDDLIVECSISSEASIQSVQVAYKYLNIVGSCWELVELEKFAGENTWWGIIEPGLFTSRVDYYIIVNLEVYEGVWFSSQLYEVDNLNNNFSIVTWILFILAVIVPLIILFWRRYNKTVAKVNETDKPKARTYLILELFALSILYGVFFLSLTLPLVGFGSSGMTWSTVHLFKDLYTWKDIFGVVAPFLTVIFLIILVLSFYLSVFKPLIASGIQFVYFIYLYLLYVIINGLIGGSGAFSEFPSIDLTIGWYLILITAIGLIIVGLWKRFYQTKLNIRTAKTKIYNIDRWFKIR